MKPHAFRLALLLALVALSGAAAAPLREPQGLRAEWTFAEGAGTAAGDSSGNGVTGTLTNGALWTTGKIGSAVQLDGVNDYVALPANLDAARNASALTVTAWVNLATLPASGAFREIVSLSVNAGAPTNTSRLAMAVVGDGTAADIFVGARSTEAEAQQTATASTADLAAGTWYHLAAVYDIAGDTIKVYRNGILLVTQAVNFSAAATPDTPSTNGALGAQDKGDSNFFHGALDEVKIYSRALSTSEVERLATGDGLRAQWKLDEGAGTSAADSSGNAFDGTVQGGAVWTTGQMGGALTLDGVDDRISLGSNLSVVRNVNAATVSAWIKPGSTIPAGQFREIVSLSVNAGAPTNVSRVALALRGDGTAGDIFAGGRSTETESQKTLGDDSNLTVGTWVHVAAVINFSAKTITLYRNGEQTATGSAPFLDTRTPNTVSTSATIGAQDTGDSNFYHGDIDDVRVYGRALSSHEIHDLLMRDCLMAHWKFDEGTGTSAADASGGGGTATLANGAAWGTGQFGSAASLDGVNDYIALPANMAVLREANAATLSGWIKLSSLPASGAFREIFSVSVNAAAPTNMSRAALAVVGDGTAADLFAGARSTDTEAQQTLTAPNANLAANTFTHVAAVFDFAGDSIKIYVNGALSASALVNFSQPATPDTDSTNGALGAQDLGDSNYFHGLLDEMKIYCRALTSNEVQALATLSPPATPTNLQAAAGDTQVTLTWSASAGATSYNVFRRLQGQATFGPAVANTAQTTFTDVGLTNGVTVEYAVSALNSAGESAKTAPVAATPTAGQPPAKPVIITQSQTTNDNTPDVVGTSDPNVSIAVFFKQGATTVETLNTTANFQGNWSVTAGPKADGAYTVTARASNAAGNSPDSDAITITVDTGAPAVASVTSTTANGAYGVGAAINITINFSEPVTLAGGNLQVTLDTGTVVSIAPFGPASSAVGTYTVAPGQNSPDLTAVSPLVLQSGATLRDAGGNNAGLSIPAGQNLGDLKNIVIDTSAPTVTSVTSTTPNGIYGAGAGINITVNFSEPVTLAGGNLSVTLSTGAVVAIAPFGPAASASGTYTVAAGHNSPDLNANSPLTLGAGATLRDSSGNDTALAIPAGQNLANLKDIVIDTTAPAVSSVTSTTANGTYGVGAAINITVNFSESVTLTGGNLQVTLDTGAVVSIAPFGPASSAAGTYTVAAGQGSADLTALSPLTLQAGATLRDAAGNNATLAIPAGQNLGDLKNIVVDTTPVPPVPANFAGVAQTTTSILWSWDNVAGETGFEVRDAAQLVKGTVGADVLSFTESSGLTENAAFLRHVNSKIGAASSADSNAVTRYTKVHDPVAGDFTVTAFSSTQIDVVVTAPPNSTAGSTGCEIDRSPDGSTGWVTIKAFSAVYAFSDTGRSPETTYFYRFRYRNGDAVVTAYSPVKSATTPAGTPPPAPTGFSGIAQTPTSILWQWNDVSGETSYEVRDGAQAVKGTVGANVLSFTESTGLSENAQFSRHVNALNGTAASPDSNVVLRYTKVHDPLAGDFTVTAFSSTQIDIAVTAPPNSTGGSTGCEIDRSPDGSTGWVTIKAFSAVYAFSDTGRSPNTTYFYRIRYRNGDAVVTAYSPVKSATTPAGPAPAAPTGFSGIAQTMTSILWQWNDVSGETSYEVRDASQAVKGTVGANVLFFTESSGLSENAQYSRHVNALNGTAASPDSNVVLRYTKVHDPVAGDFTVTVVSTSRIDINVTPPPGAASDATGCEIDRSPDGMTGWQTVKFFTDPGYSFIDSPLTSTTHFYRIRFRNGDSILTADSPAKSGTPAPPAPHISAPMNQEVIDHPFPTAFGQSALDSVVIRLYVDGVLNGSTTSSVGNPISGWTINPTNPIAEGTRVLTARTFANGVESVDSEPVTIFVNFNPPRPVLTSALPGDGQVTLTWNTFGAANDYWVYKSTTSGSFSIANFAGSSTGTSLTLTGLSNGTTYFFIVRAKTGESLSAPSNERVATPGTPAAPTMNAPVPGDGQVSLSWSTVAGAASYNVYRSTTSGNYQGSAPVASTGTSLIVTDLANGTNYFFVVTAVNGFGDGPYSNEVSARPGNPPAPILLSPVPGDTQITLTWTTSLGADSYLVFTGGSPGNYTGSVSTTSTSHTVTGLTNGTVYYFAVKAVNTVGQSPFSNEKWARPRSSAPDANAPVLTLTPMHGTKTIVQKPPFIVDYTDDISGVNPDTFQASLDVNSVTSAFMVGPFQATFTPGVNLLDGPHAWNAEIHDFAGNVAQASAAFRVVAAMTPINSSGGFVLVDDPTRAPHRARLDFPANAVSGSTHIVFSIEHVAGPAALPAGYFPVGPAVRLDPPAAFNQAVTLSAPYTAADLPAGVAEGQLRLLRYDVATAAWVVVPALPVDEINDLAVAQLMAFGSNEYFVVAAQVPADSLTDFEVVPAEVPADGASFSTVTVIPRDAEGRVIGPGLNVQVAIAGTATLGPVQDVGDGVYRALVSTSTPGVVTVSATVNNVPVVKTPPVQILFLNPRPATFTIELPSVVRAGESQSPTIRARKGDNSVETTFVGVVRLDITGTKLVSSSIEFPATLYAVFSRRHEGVLTLDHAVTFIQAGAQTVTATLMIDPTIQGSTTVTVLNAVGPLTLIGGQHLNFSGAVNTISPFPLSVRAIDPFGNPAVGTDIEFVRNQGTADFVNGPTPPVSVQQSPVTVATGADGTAIGPFVRLPATVGLTTGEIRVKDTTVSLPFKANAVLAGAVALAPTITHPQPTTGANVTTPTAVIQGTGTEGGRIDLIIDNRLSVNGTVTGGTWQITTPVLSQGVHTIYAVQSTLSANSDEGLIVSARSNALTLTVTYVAPPEPVITTPAKKTNDSTPRIEGTISTTEAVTIRLYANGQQAGETTSSNGAWVIQNASPGFTDGAFTFVARASSAVDIVSGDSNPVEIVIDVTPPAPPEALSATPGNNFVLLNWHPSPSFDTLGYNVWRRVKGQPDSSYGKINGSFPVLGTRYCDKQVTVNTTYEYRVTSIDDALNEKDP